MRTSSGRLALGLVVAVVSLAAVSGCTDDPEPVATASASVAAPTASGSASGGPTTSRPTSTLPTVAEVFRTARTSALAAASGHVVGTTTHEGQPLRIDVEGTADGSNQTVLITTPDGGTSEVVMVDDKYWLGGDEAFWVHQTGDAQAGRAMVGKYVQISESDATENGSYTLRGVLTGLFATPEIAALESDTRPVEAGEVDGRDAYVLGQEGGGRLWVATDGSGTVLRILGPASAPDDLAFSDWGRAKTFEQPPPAKVVEG